MEKTKPVIACVYRTGKEYNASHVYALRDMCAKHIPAHDFVCLSNVEDLECKTIPLLHRFHGWWSKMELFRIPGPVLYFDLDTIIRGPIDTTIFADKDFVIMRDVYRGPRNPKAMQSSVMYWGGDMSWLYKKFLSDPEECPGGDQEYIEKNIEVATYLQDIMPVASFKADVLRRGLEESDHLVIFHGQPRPWDQNVISYP